MLTIACNIPLDQPNLWERILKNDNSVCGRKNDVAFEQIRMHLMALFPLQDEAVDEIGAQATKEVLAEVRTAITELRLAGSATASVPPEN